MPSTVTASSSICPDLKAVIEAKTTDIDAFLDGMRSFTQQSTGGHGTVKALLFGAPPSEDEVRPTPEDELETKLIETPFGLHEIDEARLARPDWVITKPILSGICGSDAKLVLGDFNTGDIDNPMAAFSSLPHVPGHEVVAEVVSLGPEARGLDVGQRVVLNPWLSCGPAASIRPARPARPATSASAGVSPREISVPVSTSASSPAPRVRGRSGWPPMTPC